MKLAANTLENRVKLSAVKNYSSILLNTPNLKKFWILIKFYNLLRKWYNLWYSSFFYSTYGRAEKIAHENLWVQWPHVAQHDKNCFLKAVFCVLQKLVTLPSHFSLPVHTTAHSQKVSCLDIGETGRVLVTGGHDRLVNLFAIGNSNSIQVRDPVWWRRKEMMKMSRV